MLPTAVFCHPLGWMLLLGAHVLRHSYMLSISSSTYPICSFSPFQLTHVFQHPLFSLHPVYFQYACPQLSGSPLAISSLRIQPWPRGLGCNTCTLPAPKVQSTIWSWGIWTGLINGLYTFLSCLFTLESFDPGSLCFSRTSQRCELKWRSGRRSSERAQRSCACLYPGYGCSTNTLGLTLKVHLSCTSVHLPSVHDCAQYGRTRSLPYNLESLTVWASLWNTLLL